MIASAQSETFYRYSESDGLPPSTVLSILQDDIGFLWIGTTDGLFRYDGHEFREFRHNLNDSTSLSNNYIRTLFQDSEENIWVGTKKGLNCYSPKKESFTRFVLVGDSISTKESNNILSIAEDSSGHIWNGSYHGLFRRKIGEKNVLHFLPEKENPNSISHKFVWSVFVDSKNRIWAITQKGVNKLEQDGSFRFQKYMPEPGKPDAIQDMRTWLMIEQPNSTLWMGSDHGLYRLEENEKEIKFRLFSHDKNNPNSLSYNLVNTLLQDGNEKIWAGTWDGGLNEIIVPEKNSSDLFFIHHKHNASNKESVSSNLINALEKDNSGNLWIGTSAGLDKWAPKANKFINIVPDKNIENGLSIGVVTAVMRDQWGGVWVATLDGLNYLSPTDYENNNFEFQKMEVGLNEKGKLTHKRIYSLYEDEKGYLWIGTYLGLNYLNLNDFYKNEKTQFRFFGDLNGLPHTFIRNVNGLGDGSIWVGTYEGVARMEFNEEDPIQTVFHKVNSSNQEVLNVLSRNVYCTTKDKHGYTWIGTSAGLVKSLNDKKLKQFEFYTTNHSDNKSLRNDVINDLHLDKKGQLWVATRGGLSLVVHSVNKEAVSFKTFGVEDGLPSDLILSIEEDSAGFLWLGTNRGLVKFNSDKIDLVESPVEKIFTNQDGLAATFQVRGATFKDKEGTLFFGTPSGLSILKSGDLQENNKSPKVVFSKLLLNNKEVKIGEGDFLKESITNTKALTIGHEEVVVEVHFASLDFTRPDKNRYSYILEGFDEEWVDNGGSNKVRFTSLPSGTYTLKVKGTNNDGIWSRENAILKIRVLPPPWKTWWAYSFYALMLGFVLFGFYRFRLNQKLRKFKEEANLQKARFEERDAMRKQNAADFHDELGHRLTKINLFIEMAERQKENKEGLSVYLSKIRNNISGLSSGVRDLIWTLDPTSDSLFQTVLRMQEFGEQLFDKTRTRFIPGNFSSDWSNIELDSNMRKHILMIAKEVMNNCLKYAEAENCTLSFNVEGDFFTMSFKDDGRGFDFGKSRKGYGLANMEKRTKEIGGNIEIKSGIGKGTEVTLKVQMPHMG